jgi:cyclic pyranopterin phosphate synthase
LRSEAEGSYIDPALIDSFGRRHRYLRVSLTDRCNLRCQYCMPEEGEEFAAPSPGGDLLTAEELAHLVGLFVRLGVRKVRLTGGEPTIRRDFGRIIEDLGKLNAGLPEPLSIGITTNGVRLKKFLPQLRAAGVRNVNLSLDTLVAAKFPLLARRPQAWHARTVDVLREVASQEEHFRLKVNCVLLRGINEDEVGDFMDLTEHLPIEVRFLEFMPFDGNSWNEGRMVPQAAIVAAIHEHSIRRGQGPAERLPPDSLNDVANLWRVPGWRGRLGVIASMTDAFCGGCNRIRLTSDGQLRNCLFGEEGWSLRDALRAGASDAALAVEVATGLQRKFRSLGGKRDMHELRERGGLALPMVALGG